MKFILQDINFNTLKKKKLFFFEKKNVVKLVRLRHRVLLVDTKSYEFNNSIFLLERVTGFRTKVQKFYYHNQYLKDRNLSLIVFLEALLSAKYIYNYINFLFYYAHNFSFLLNKFNTRRNFILFQNIKFNKKLFSMIVYDSYRFTNFFNRYNAFLIRYLKYERFICYIYIYNNLLNITYS
jgi:hypothetical protein